MSMLLMLNKLYDYHYWATYRLFDHAAHISTADYHAPSDFPMGSIHATLVHTYDADCAWGLRCRIGETSVWLLPEDFPTLTSLREAWQAEEVAMRAYLATLDDATLQGDITYRKSDGEAMTRPLYPILLHIVLHAGQHRAEVAALLTRYGASPGDLDMTRMLYG